MDLVSPEQEIPPAIHAIYAESVPSGALLQFQGIAPAAGTAEEFHNFLVCWLHSLSPGLHPSALMLLLRMKEFKHPTPQEDTEWI